MRRLYFDLFSGRKNNKQTKPAIKKKTDKPKKERERINKLKTRLSFRGKICRDHQLKKAL